MSFKIFESSGWTSLEDKMNKWEQQNPDVHVDNTSVSVDHRNGFYTALVHYTDSKTEPLKNDK